MTDKVGDHPAGTSMLVPGFPHVTGTAVDTRPPTRDYSELVLLLGRLKPGRALESRRVVHVFPVASGVAHAPTLTASCGERLAAGDLQWLPGLTGMPCEPCVLRSVAAG